MSDTAQSSGPIAGITKVKKISLQVFGGGRKPSEEEAAKGGALIGKIMGKATGVRSQESVSENGEVKNFDAISGLFRATFNTYTDKDGKPVEREPVTAGTLYLPGGFHEDMCDALAPVDPASNVRKANGNVIEFVFEVFCIPSSNRAGFAYKIVPIHEAAKHETSDIFARLGGFAAHDKKALPAPAAKK